MIESPPAYKPTVKNGKKYLVPNLLPHQKEFFYSKKPEALFVGGWGSGKTDVACKKCFKKLLDNPTKMIIMTQPTYQHIIDIYFATFRKQLGSIGMVEHRDYVLRQQAKELKIRRRGRYIPGKILFRSLDNPENIFGVNDVIHIHLDELDRLPKKKALEAIGQCWGRLRGVEGASLSATTTPEGIGRGCYEYFVQKHDPERQEVIHAKTEQNPYLPSSYAKNLKNTLPENLLKAYLYGEWVNFAEGAVYPYFDKDIHVLDEMPLDLKKPLYLTCDFNVSPCVFLLVQSWGGYHDDLEYREEYNIADTAINVIDEITLNNTTTLRMAEKTADRIKKLCDGNVIPPVIINGDPAGNSRSTVGDTDYNQLITTLENSGIAVTKEVSTSAPLVKDRVTTVNAHLANGKIRVSKKCKMLIGDFIKVVWKENGSDIDKAMDYTLTHASDAFGYHVYRYFRLIRIRRGHTKQVTA